MCVYIYIYIYIYITRVPQGGKRAAVRSHNLFSRHVKSRVSNPRTVLHSAKGGAVETGCSGLHYIIGCFII